jgi:hypothetical protein
MRQRQANLEIQRSTRGQRVHTDLRARLYIHICTRGLLGVYPNHPLHATLNDFELRHINVKNVYLNAPLDEEIYMVAPKGCKSQYWRLCKGLYGLRQAERQWYLHLHEAYSSLGFTRCQSDWSVYVRKSLSSLTILATSVDDLLLTSNSKSESDLAASQIKQKFAITDGGDTEWLLGCRI